jgi:hypothetical protein
VGGPGVDGPAGGGRAVVFVNGEYEDDGFYRRRFAGADLTIAADGGARFLLRAGLLPDVLVGDFDSLDESQVEALAAAGVRVVRHAVSHYGVRAFEPHSPGFFSTSSEGRRRCCEANC